MKKVIRFVAMVISIMLILSAFCFSVYADMGGPIFISYLVKVANAEGAKGEYSKWNEITEDYDKFPITVPQNEILTITGESYSKDGSLELSASYDGENVVISSKDVKMIKDSVDSSETRKIEEPLNVVVINEDGAAVRKGPAEGYAEIGRIPYGTEITCDLMQKDMGDVESWGYVKFNGLEGWVNFSEYGYGFDFASINEPEYTGEAMVISENVRLSLYPFDIDGNEYYSNYDNKYVSGEIPVGTVLKFECYYSHPKQVFVYTEYKGVKGWLLADEYYNGGGYREKCAFGEERTIINCTHNEVKLFSEPFDGGTFLGEYLEYNVPAVSDMNALDCSEKMPTFSEENSEDYYYYRSYRVTVNGKTGWITDDENIMVENYWDETYYAPEKLNVYSEPDALSKVVAEIPQFGEISCRFYGNSEYPYTYISNKEFSGWVEKNDLARESNIIASFDHDVKMYKTLDEEDDAILTIPGYERFEALYTMDSGSGMYVRYMGLEGWVFDDDYECLEEIEKTTSAAIGTETGTEAAAAQETENSSSGVSVKTLIICCVATAAIISISAIVIFKFVNKKKKEQE